ncbi:ASCH domain-containing protein [Phytohabitans houttuyneae]|uniref:ASCH domain-containing protein n=1 Tax=Phytohabitans houttuyneae TaxID=1076126 RepID=A0A6V8KKJ2_9ACTN|nr:ASCH domain-containing protein [Phytohabitans houttuyneae]GFJ82921.1 ASCH domain-containing protein [Phytohabitans houttuyneae]
MTGAVERMWHEFREATGAGGELAGSFAFGDSPAMADELARLVRHGPKRATAGLVLEFEQDGEPIPRPGDHWAVLGGDGQPVCLIRTVEVRIAPLDTVDAAFAFDEGEGDRSLAYWQAAHRRYFTRVCERAGVPFREDLPTVFERFAVVWPRR